MQNMNNFFQDLVNKITNEFDYKFDPYFYMQ